MSIETDARIKFGQSIRLDGPSAILSVEVFGGPIAAVQVALFDANDRVLDGVGFDGKAVLTSDKQHTANWLFAPRPDAAYIKWGILPMRLSAGLGGYSITGKVRDHNGNTLVAGRFAGTIPDGEASDDVVFDGVLLAPSHLSPLPGGVQP